MKYTPNVANVVPGLTDADFTLDLALDLALDLPLDYVSSF